MSDANSNGAKSILFICGSLRKESLNRQIGEYVRGIIGDAAKTSWLEYSDIPYMNQDIEFPAPDAVARIRGEVQVADAIWICSPEYNHNIPGVLKNCIDWLSRAVTKGGIDSVLRGKLATFCCGAGSSCGHFCATGLEMTLLITGAELLLTSRTLVGFDREEYATSVLALKDREKAALKEQAEMLLHALGL